MKKLIIALVAIGVLYLGINFAIKVVERIESEKAVNEQLEGVRLNARLAEARAYIRSIELCVAQDNMAGKIIPNVITKTNYICNNYDSNYLQNLDSVELKIENNEKIVSGIVVHGNETYEFDGTKIILKK